MAEELELIHHNFWDLPDSGRDFNLVKKEAQGLRHNSKWLYNKGLVEMLCYLRGKEVRYSYIRKDTDLKLSNIARCLKFLREQGFVYRRVEMQGSPFMCFYGITPKGEDLLQILKYLGKAKPEDENA